MGMMRADTEARAGQVPCMSNIQFVVVRVMGSGIGRRSVRGVCGCILVFGAGDKGTRKRGSNGCDEIVTDEGGQVCALDEEKDY